MHVIILGAPGSGKGTQSAEIVKQFTLEHLSTGDMLRAEISAGSELGLAAKSVMDAGDLVSDDIILGMVENKITANQSGILFDGFPRTLPQAKALDKLLKDADQSIHCVIQLDVDNEEIVERMLARGRADDNEETIRNRLSVYEEQTAPLIAYYRDQNKLSTVLGTGSITDIFARIEKILAK
ncbi:adenylate kinase [Ostreibacterium oceani]|uniref:Adenylate kinase n=1 Tax=Ostreibacterium oceani TaxID=2654998 RepID=A0A6N7F067_9GAMM|nr:adenylate kinase [Ostreibacterium oceani]MPV85236.1 adenylate kinase [Ostreibacterium oceani]